MQEAKQFLLDVLSDLHSHLLLGKKTLKVVSNPEKTIVAKRNVDMSLEKPEVQSEVLFDKPDTLKKNQKEPVQARFISQKNINDIDDMNELKSQCEKCTKCRLFQSRRNVVFGSGNPQSKLLIIGEAPGAQEDRQGQPFVGAAGELLTKMLRAIDVDRRDIFITNILKCRPPGNRNPRSDEIDMCTPYLKRQIEMLNPEIILTLGRFASSYILETSQGIMSLRGKSYEKNGRIIFPTLHPSALLHNPQLKRPAWEDLKSLKEILMEKGFYDN